MLKLFKQNDIVSAFALLLVGFGLKASYIYYPPNADDLQQFERATLFSMSGLKAFYLSHPSLYIFFSICVLFLFSIYLNAIVNREKFLQRKTYLPALSLMLISSLAPVLHVFSAPMISSLLIFFAFSGMMKLYHSTHPRRDCFNVGMLVSLAAIFYFPSLLFFFLFLLLLLLLRPFVLEENLAYLLGVLTPVYFALGLLYLSGHWYDTWTILYLSLVPPLRTMPLAPLLIMMLTSVVLMVYALYQVNQAGPKNSISVRKKWNAVVIYLIFACVIGSFSPLFPGIPWILTVPPISIILSQAFLHNREKYNTFTFLFLVLAAILIQWLL